MGGGAINTRTARLPIWALVVRVVRDPSSALLFGQLALAAAAFVINIIAARGLGPTGRGELALLLQIGYLSSIGLLFGIDKSVVTVYADLSPRTTTMAFFRLMAYPSAVGLAIATGISVLPLHSLGTWQERFALAMTFGVINAAVRAARSIAIATNRTHDYLLWTITSQVLLLMVLALLLVLDITDSGLWLVVYAISGAVTTGIFLARLYRAHPVEDDRTYEQRRRRRARIEGAKLFPATIATSGMLRIDRLLIPVMASTAALGVYASVSTITELLAWPVISLADSRLGSWRKAWDRGQLAIGRIILCTILFLGLAGVVFGASVYLLIRPLLGVEFASATVLIPPLVAAAAMFGISQIHIALLTARRRNTFASIAQSAGFILSVLLYLMWIPQSGAEGAAWASLVGYAGTAFLSGAFLLGPPRKQPGFAAKDMQ